MIGFATGAKKLDGPTLDRIKAAGAHATRWGARWTAVEPKLGGPYNWKGLDELIQLHLDRDLDICLSGTGRGDQDLLGGAQTDAYAKFMAAVAERYVPGGNIAAIEGPNEPNNHHYYTLPDNGFDAAQLYAPVQKALYEAVKAVAPGVPVVSGGLASGGPGDVTNWVKGFYAAGSKPYFDALCYHPYTYPLSPKESFQQNARGFGAMHEARMLMVANGDARKQIHITEYGTPTGGKAACTEQQQADFLKEAVTRFRRHAYGGMFFAFLHDDSDDLTGHNGDYMGHWTSDKTGNKPKLSVETFKTLAANGA